MACELYDRNIVVLRMVFLDIMCIYIKRENDAFKLVSKMARYYCCSSFTLNSLNYAAALFHLMQAAIVLGLIQHLNHKNTDTAGKYGLNSGVFKITKNSFIITTKEITSLKNTKSKNDEIMLSSSNTQDTNKCSMPPVNIYNLSDISTWMIDHHGIPSSSSINNNITSTAPSMNTTAALKETTSQDVVLFSAAFNYFFNQYSDTVITVERNDIFTFEEKYYVIPQTFHVGDLDIRYIIFSFFLFSGLFQLADGFMGAYTAYAVTSLIPSKPRLLRFVEYSFSASIMILAIGVETGINDIYILCGIFTLIFTTNILGLIAEIFCFLAEGLLMTSNHEATGLNRIEKHLPVSIAWLWTIPHFLGWITCILGYSPLLDSYLHSTQCSERGPPGFVHVIVFLEFILFSCFGFVQLYSLYYRTLVIINNPGGGRNVSAYSSLIVRNDGASIGTQLSNLYDDDGETSSSGRQGGDYYRGKASISEQADYMYILLSFIAKTLLAWLILSPSLMNSNN